MKTETKRKTEKSSKAVSTPKKVESKGLKRRRQIIDMSKQVLMSAGYNGLVLRDIAERIGITHGNLQYYFPTKNDLLMAIFDEEILSYTKSMKEAVSATSSKKGRLYAIIDSGIKEMGRPEVALWRMMMSLSDHSPEMASILKKENDQYDRELVKELEFISPNLSVKRRQHIAWIIQTILDGYGIKLAYENVDSPEMQALASEIKVALMLIIEGD